MGFIKYLGERIVDILAALILRASYRIIDQFFAPDVNGETGDLYVPLGTSVRAGSGGVLAYIGGGDSPRSSVREGESEVVVGEDVAVFDLSNRD